MKICVIGTGTMAKGIVKAFAAKMPVVMKSRTQASLDKTMASFAKSYGKLVEKGKLTQETVDAILNNITTTTDYSAFADADLVIEAAVENMQLKKDVFMELDKICKPETIFATNSSSLSITEIAACTSRPTQFIGMHFFNPADRMALVEVIKGQVTSDEVCKTIVDLSTSIGKTPVPVNEAPGFVVNRILITMINEAVGILADGIASAEDIDKCMMLGANHPMGPLELGDLIGLDICLTIMRVMFDETKDSKYRPCPLLTKMVRAGSLGVKSGKGFYIYHEDGTKTYDFQYYDKDGYPVTLSGLSRTFNPEFWNYAKMISALLRHEIPMESIINIIFFFFYKYMNCILCLKNCKNCSLQNRIYKKKNRQR